MARHAPGDRTEAEDLLLVGRCGKAHGIRGEVKVVPETDDPHRLRDVKVLYVGEDAKGAQARDVESVRFQQSKLGLTVVLKLAAVATRAEAEELRGAFVFARRRDLPQLDDDEFFLHDAVGLSVVTEVGEAVGTVSDVVELPGQSLYVISRPGKPDALIPAVPAFILDVDFESGQLVIRPIEGLLE